MSETKTELLHISDAAREAFASAIEEGSEDVVLLSVDPWFRVSLGIGPLEEGDLRIELGELVIALDAASVERIEGASIDYVEDAGAWGFKIDNPNEPPPVREISATELHARRQAGELPELFDVRTPAERAIALIEGARLYDDDAAAHMESLDRETPLVFACHHGVRSRTAAEHARTLGFKVVYNLVGGIDAWSLDVDPSVRRY